MVGRPAAAGRDETHRLRVLGIKQPAAGGEWSGWGRRGGLGPAVEFPRPKFPNFLASVAKTNLAKKNPGGGQEGKKSQTVRRTRIVVV